MKKRLMGWHGDYFWNGLFWDTRTYTVNKKKCIGTGLSIEEAQADLKKQIIDANSFSAGN